MIRGGRDDVDLKVRSKPQGLFEKHVAWRDQQHLEGTGRAGHRGRRVIDGEDVAGREARRHGGCIRWNGEDDVLPLSGRQGQRPDIEQVTVGAPFQADRPDLLAEVLQMHIGRARLRAGAHGQRGQSDVLSRNADPMVLDGKRQTGSEGRAQRLDDAVGEQVGSCVVAGSNQARGQR